MDININKSDLEKYYDELKCYHEKYLKQYGVHLPKLYYSKEKSKYTKAALSLIYLYINYRSSVKKSDLTNFIRYWGLEIDDAQQARHYGAQYGWYIITGKRGDKQCEEFGVKSGEYALIFLDEPYPNFTKKKRTTELSNDEWESKKKEYDYRCATCGSKEGEANFHYPNTNTKLEKGHMDPSKPLTYKNTIPQCSKCNKPDKNFFVYNAKGRVVKIANPEFVLRSTKEIKIEMLKLLKEDLDD